MPIIASPPINNAHPTPLHTSQLHEPPPPPCECNTLSEQQQVLSPQFLERAGPKWADLFPQRLEQGEQAERQRGGDRGATGGRR